MASVELMLIALVLVVGLITGWVKLRDQSLSEIKDSMAAIDAYILGSGPLWQTGGTRYICPEGDTIGSSVCGASGSVLEPSSAGAVTESWDGNPYVLAQETSAGSHIYQVKDGVLIYSTPGPE